MIANVDRISRRAFHVWRRNAEIYRTTWKINFLPPLLEPVYYILAFGLGMGSMVGMVTYQNHEVSYLRFMVPGVLAVAIMFWAYFENTYSTFVRMYFQGTFDALMSTPLLVEDIIVGEWIWGATKSVIATTIMLLMTSAFGLIEWPSGAWVVAIAALGGLLFGAIGLITTAITPGIEVFNVPMFVLVFPMFLFSGTFFPIDILPPWAYWFAMVLPLTHVSFLVRGVCLGQLPSFWPVSVAYLVIATVVATLVAIVLMRRRLVK